jgi:hypothetical protein
VPQSVNALPMVMVTVAAFFTLEGRLHSQD